MPREPGRMCPGELGHAACGNHCRVITGRWEKVRGGIDDWDDVVSTMVVNEAVGHICATWKLGMKATLSADFDFGRPA